MEENWYAQFGDLWTRCAFPSHNCVHTQKWNVFVLQKEIACEYSSGGGGLREMARHFPT